MDPKTASKHVRAESRPSHESRAGRLPSRPLSLAPALTPSVAKSHDGRRYRLRDAVQRERIALRP